MMAIKNLAEQYQISPEYWEELYFLQVELLKLQKWVVDEGLRLSIVCEGRDAAGKGGAILRFTQNMNPRHYRIVALGKPSDLEKGQWYFQRYIKELPNRGEIVFFDRSWYNRAVVEPVMGFCTKAQYRLFLKQVGPFEKMIVEDGIHLTKFWFSIELVEQKDRLKAREINPLRSWKMSPVDRLALEKFETFSKYKEIMFRKTSKPKSPWMIVKGNIKELARLNSIRYILSKFDYPDKPDNFADPLSEIVYTFS